MSEVRLAEGVHGQTLENALIRLEVNLDAGTYDVVRTDLPENELPLPRITPPGVPEAQPLPATPNGALLPAPSVKPGVETKLVK